MWTFQRSSSSVVFSTLLLLAALTLLLSVGLVACDSGGSNDDGTQDGNNENGTVAQTFQVTVESVDGTDYQYADQNDVGVAYAIGGTVGNTITLERGKTYEFELGDGVDGGPNGATHPFYVGDTAEGGGGDEYSDGVSNANATTGTVTFTVPSDAPNTLYYLCGAHVYMGGDITITDSSGESSNDTGY